MSADNNHSHEPAPHERFVRVSVELVAELKAAPSAPVTVRIEEREGSELAMLFTRHYCEDSWRVEEPK
jgi:hypothetical protein